MGCVGEKPSSASSLAIPSVLSAWRRSRLRPRACVQLAIAGANAFTRRSARFFARWLKDDLRRRDFGETLNVIDRLAHSNEDLAHYHNLVVDETKDADNDCKVDEVAVMFPSLAKSARVPADKPNKPARTSKPVKLKTAKAETAKPRKSKRA